VSPHRDGRSPFQTSSCRLTCHPSPPAGSHRHGDVDDALLQQQGGQVGRVAEALRLGQEDGAALRVVGVVAIGGAGPLVGAAAGGAAGGGVEVGWGGILGKQGWEAGGSGHIRGRVAAIRVGSGHLGSIWVLSVGI
jgi:hypothetical protein